jgi:2-amino-4-hydroxy-6-hydroxymethyldihydropteridine diphosphokinase
MKSKIKNQKSKIAFIALGSNLGHSAALVQQAMECLQALSDQPLRCSSLWRTEPVDCPPGSPHFVNAVVGLVARAGETPESLLERLQVLERELGRQPKRIPNEPRTLDLDLIAFGQERRNTARLVLPHPRAHQRRFVLQPLSEIAPALVLPGQTATVRELLHLLAAGGPHPTARPILLHRGGFRKQRNAGFRILLGR